MNTTFMLLEKYDSKYNLFFYGISEDKEENIKGKINENLLWKYPWDWQGQSRGN